MVYDIKVIRCGTLFLAMLFTHNAFSATFTVSGTDGGLDAPWPGAPGTSQSSTPGLSLNEYQSRFQTGALQDIKWAAVADAHSVGVFAESRTFQAATSTVGARTSALFRYDDLVFDSADNTNITVSLALHYTGVVSARKVQGDGGQTAAAGIRNRVNLDGIGATNSTDFNLSLPGLAQAVCGTGCALGVIESVVYDQVLIHTWNNVPTNTPMSLEVGLLSNVFVNPNFSQGGYATSDFANTLTLANPGAVFMLPDGVTSNSVEMGLGNNTVVPEPLSGVLLSLGLFFITVIRRPKHP